MPQISLRACEMPEPPIRKLFPLAEAAKARGVKALSSQHRPARSAHAAGGAGRLEAGRPHRAGIQPQRRLPVAARKAGRVLRPVPDPPDGRRHHRHDGRLRSGAFRLHVVPQSGRRDHRTRTGLRQLHGFRRIGRRRDPADHRLDRGRLRAAVGREVRGAYQRPHARHPDLQPQQPDGVPLYAPRDDADPRSGEALRPFSLFGRSLPRIHLYGVALYLGLPIWRGSSRTWC